MIRLLFTSGRGPAECRMAVALALRRVAAEAEAAGCDCAIAEEDHAGAHGPPSAVVVLDGEAAADLARRWSAGSVLWVNRSPLRPGHARKNWFVGVVVLPEAAANGLAAPARAPTSASKAFGRAGPAASIRIRPKAPCAPFMGRRASPRPRETGGRNTATRCSPSNVSRRCSMHGRVSRMTGTRA
jgi:hypothetical protein